MHILNDAKFQSILQKWWYCCIVVVRRYVFQYKVPTASPVISYWVQDSILREKSFCFCFHYSNTLWRFYIVGLAVRGRSTCHPVMRLCCLIKIFNEFSVYLKCLCKILCLFHNIKKYLLLSFTYFRANFHEIDPLYLNRPFFPSVLWHCWFGCVTCKIVPKMTCYVSDGM